MNEFRVFNKLEEYSNFFKLPAEVRNYIYLPNYTADMNYLYCLIIGYYNAEKGYAFPNMHILAREYGKTPKTTSKHLKVLEKYKLISIQKTLGNNRYVPYTPLNKEKLFEYYPVAEENYEKEKLKEEKEKQRSLDYKIKNTTEEYYDDIDEIINIL